MASLPYNLTGNQIRVDSVALTATGPTIVFGSGAPTGLSATKGSLYMNNTATTTTTRLYINTDGGTTWTTFTTAA